MIGNHEAVVVDCAGGTDSSHEVVVGEFKGGLNGSSYVCTQKEIDRARDRKAVN